jgi:hypothetical protein
MSYYAAIDGSSVLRIFSLVLLGIATTVFLFIALSIIFAKIPEFPSLQTLVKSKVDHYFDNINQIYVKKGFWWRIAPELLFIEMVIEDRIPHGLNLNHLSGNPEILTSSRKEEEKTTKKRHGYSQIGNDEVTPVQVLSNRSKKKPTAKVTPISSTKLEPVALLGSKSNQDFMTNKSYQAQPLKLKSKPQQEQNYSSQESEGEGEGEAENRGPVIQSDPSRSGKHRDYAASKPQPNPNFEYNQNFGAQNYANKSQPPRSVKQGGFSSPKDLSNISPEQRLKNAQRDYYEEDSREEDGEGEDPEQSMKIDELLGNYEADTLQHRPHPPNKQVVTAHYPQKKNKYGFGEPENSHFGTEWMSDKGK